MASEAVYKVKITIHAGRDLVSKDSNGLSDPYCIPSIDRSTYKPEKTKVCKKTLNPVWTDKNEFWLNVKDAAVEKGKIIIDILDKDLVNSDDTMGCVEIPLKGLVKGKEERKWHKVVQALTTASADAKGELEVSVLASDFGQEE